MTDTVNRLMILADEYSVAVHVARSGSLTGLHIRVDDACAKRDALESELTRLLTPLSDEQVYEICIEASKQLRDYTLGISNEKPLSVCRLTEQAHGITLHSDKSSFLGGAE